MRVSVAARSHAAAVEMQRELGATTAGSCGPEGGAWAVILPSGAVACSGRDLTRELKVGSAASGDAPADEPAGAVAPTRLVAQDHVFGGAAEAAAGAARPTVVVHGVLGTASLKDLHSVAVAAAREGRVTYALRHWAAAEPGSGPVSTRLSGWGAGLDVKNTEYRVTDDRAAETAACEGGAGCGADGEEAGGAAPGSGSAVRVPGAEAMLSAPAAEVRWAADGSVAGATAAAKAGADAGAGPDGSRAGDADVLAALLAAHRRWRSADPSLPDAASMQVSEVNATGIGVRTTAYVLEASGRTEAGVTFLRDRRRAAATARETMRSEAIEAKRRRLTRAAERKGGKAPGSVVLTRSEEIALARAPVRGLESEEDAQRRFDASWASSDTAPEASHPLRDPLVLLTRLTGSFPAAAPALSTAPVDRAVLSAVRANAHAIPHGQNVVLVNGRPIDATAASFNFFSVLRTLQDEASVLAQFGALPVSDPAALAAHALASSGQAAAPAPGDEDADPVAAAEGGTASLRVDYRPGSDRAVLWLSDVEKDAPFRRFGRSVRGILAQSWQLHSVRRNLYNAVLLGDASSPGGLRAVLTAFMYSEHAAPIRFGFVPIAPEAAAPTAELEAAAAAAAAGEPAPPRDVAAPDDAVDGLDIALLAFDAEQRHGPAAAREFLVSIAQQWQQGLQAAMHKLQAVARSQAELQELAQSLDMSQPILGEQAVKAYASAVAAKQGVSGVFGGSGRQEAAATALRDASGAGRARILEVRRWATGLGIPTPGFLLNGRPGAGLAVQESMMTHVQADMQTLQRLVRLGHVDDKERSDALAVLLSSSGTVPLFHEAALDTRSRPFVPLASAAAAPLLFGVRRTHAPGEPDAPKPATVDLLDDLAAPIGLRSAAAALAALDLPAMSATARVGLIHTGPAAAERPGGFPALVTAASWAIGDDAGPAPVRFDDRLPALRLVVAAGLEAASRNKTARAAAKALASPSGRFSLAAVLRGAPLDRVLAVVRAASRTGKAADKAANTAAAAAPAASRTFASTAQPLPADANAALAECWSRATAARSAALALVPRARAGPSAPAGATPKLTPSGALRALLVNGRVVALGAAEELVPQVVAAAAGAEARARGTKVLATLAASRVLSVLPDEDEDDAAEPSGAGAELEAAAAAHRAGPWAVRPDDATAELTSALAAAASSALGAYASEGVRQRLPAEYLDAVMTSFVSVPRSVLTGGAAPSGIEVEALLDPVSEAAQRAAPLLLLLRDALGARVRVFLHPNSNQRGTGEDGDRKLPLPSFYRFAGPGIAAGAADSALFEGLPSFLMTAKVYPPEPWDVQAASSPVDADNIQLLPADRLRLGYTVKSLLIAGQCEEADATAPPNGLQLQLGPAPGLPAVAEAGSDPVLPGTPAAARALADTLVMQNLGYFQLRTQPGARALALAPGRASTIFEIAIPEGAGSDGRLDGNARTGGLRNVGTKHRALEGETADEEPPMRAVPFLEVSVRDFVGDLVQLQVRRRDGQEKARLLAEDGEDIHDDSAAVTAQGGGGLWGSISSFFGGGSGDAPAVANATASDGRLHVFSLASGHAYERFLKIMMLSVTKRASRPVTFWLVENFLSPQFKQAIPALAEA